MEDHLLPYITSCLYGFYRIPLPLGFVPPPDFDSAVSVVGGPDKVLQLFQSRNRRRNDRLKVHSVSSIAAENSSLPSLKSLLESPLPSSFRTALALLSDGNPAAFRLFSAQTLFHRFQRMDIYDAIDVLHGNLDNSDVKLFESTAGPESLVILLHQLLSIFSSDPVRGSLHETLSLAICGLACRCDCLNMKNSPDSRGGTLLPSLISVFTTVTAQHQQQQQNHQQQQQQNFIQLAPKLTLLSLLASLSTCLFSDAPKKLSIHPLFLKTQREYFGSEVGQTFLITVLSEVSE